MINEVNEVPEVNRVNRPSKLSELIKIVDCGVFDDIELFEKYTANDMLWTLSIDIQFPSRAFWAINQRASKICKMYENDPEIIMMLYRDFKMPLAIGNNNLTKNKTIRNYEEYNLFDLLPGEVAVEVFYNLVSYNDLLAIKWFYRKYCKTKFNTSLLFRAIFNDHTGIIEFLISYDAINFDTTKFKELKEYAAELELTGKKTAAKISLIEQKYAGYIGIMGHVGHMGHNGYLK